MRSSNYRHLKNNDLEAKHGRHIRELSKLSKVGSFIVALFIAVAAIIIPSISLVQNVAAADRSSKFNVGDCDVINNAVAVPSLPQIKKASVNKPESETKSQTEPAAVEETQTESGSSASGQHIALSDYDRTLLEGLVMGEAGGCGYETSALVAQAVHDSMIESGTTSVETIAAEYKYDASMSNVPTSAVKEAVSFIFDCDGRAVDHRILYFYASDIVTSEWHESQNFVTSCGSMRFFDKW